MIRFPIRVSPGASRAEVGGAYGEALRIRVHAPVVDGRANSAVITAIAEAFDVRPSAVRITHGLSGRSKIIEIDGDTEPLAARLDQLRLE